MGADDDAFSDALRRPLDRSGEIPVGAQLAWRLRMLIAAGELHPGDRLPSARELARAVGVNVNTVFAVYGRLEGDGLVTTEHGRGSFVRELPPDAADVASLAREAATAAHAAGLDPRQVAMSLFADQGSGQPADDPRERRRLREQITELELRLARLAPAASHDAAATPPAPARPRLLDQVALMQTRDRLQAEVDGLAAVAEQRRAEARHRRRSAATTTLESRSASPARSEPDRPRPATTVRWTPHWGTT